MITTEQAERELREIAAGRPDHVYESPQLGTNAGGCFYVHGVADEDVVTVEPRDAHSWQTGCIVGEWLHRYHDVSLADLLRVNQDGAQDIFESLGIDAEDGVPYLAGEVQDRQDKGLPWGMAVDAGIAAWGGYDGSAEDEDGDDWEGEEL